MSKVALITGVSGQDGAYLSQLLLEKGYKVIGLIRHSDDSNLNGLLYLRIRDEVEIIQCDLLDISQVMKIIQQTRPNEIYNLAAQSSVSQSFAQPIGTISFNILSVLNLLEAIKIVDPTIKLYQASSSEMFGNVKNLPITEGTEFHPVSPYAVSKAAAHWSCVNYRESYGMFVNCGILFNHESYLRKKNFFIKKVITEAINIRNGKQNILEVGNIDIYRDFGYAPKYVEAMYLMMQQAESDNCLICSGQPVSLRYIIEYVFKSLDIDLSRIVVSHKLFRPSELKSIYGNPEKARQLLNWDSHFTIEQVLDKLICEEIENAPLLMEN